MTESSEQHCQMSCADITVFWDKDVSRHFSDEENHAFSHHLAECEDCRKFVKLTSNLSLLLEDLSENEIKSAVNNVMEVAAEHRMLHLRRLPRWGVVTVISAVAALAIVGVIQVFLLASDTSKPSVDFNCLASEPKELASGIFLSYCNESNPGIIVENSSVTVPLPHGTVGLFVDPNRPDKRKVVVQTPHGQVLVKGTIFTVQTESGNSRVEVFRGVVEIAPTGDSNPFSVSSEHAAEMIGGRVVALTNPRTEVLHRKLIALTSRTEPSTTHDGDKFAKVKSSKNITDSKISKGTAVLNRHTKQVVPETGRITDDSQKSPDEAMYSLIQTAQSCLIDHDWRCAVEQYQEVLAHYSKRPESLAVLISLAKIELRHQGAPQNALAHYKAYRKRAPNGPLAEEAHFGIAEAYRSLGRIDEEKSTLREFVIRYPESPLLQKARSRLQQIER